jgi:hypothetical protein
VRQLTDSLYEFTPGERTVLFLKENSRRTLRVDNTIPLDLVDRFTVRPDGQASNGYQTMPLQQLLDQLATFLAS